MYDSATPNPTGSLSGPWIDEGSGSSKNVTGKISTISNEYLLVKNEKTLAFTYLSTVLKNNISIVCFQGLDPCILALNFQTVIRRLSYFYISTIYYHMDYIHKLH